MPEITFPSRSRSADLRALADKAVADMTFTLPYDVAAKHLRLPASDPQALAYLADLSRSLNAYTHERWSRAPHWDSDEDRKAWFVGVARGVRDLWGDAEMMALAMQALDKEAA